MSKPRPEIICYICKKPGHIATKYNQNKESKNNQPSGEIDFVSSLLNDKSFLKFVRQLQVGDLNLTVQIDFGASVCTMRASTVLNENFDLIPIKSKLGGFGYSEVCSPGYFGKTIHGGSRYIKYSYR